MPGPAVTPNCTRSCGAAGGRSGHSRARLLLWGPQLDVLDVAVLVGDRVLVLKRVEGGHHARVECAVQGPPHLRAQGSGV